MRGCPGSSDVITSGSAPRWLFPTDLVDRSLADPLAWFEMERTNLVAAAEAAAGNGLEEAAWELAGCLTSFFLMRSYWLAWDHVHEVVLVACRQAGNRRGEAAAVAGIGYAMSAERLRGRLDDGEAMRSRAIEIFRDLGDQRGEAKALHALAEVLKRIGIFQAPATLQATVDYATQSLHLARIIGDPSLQVDALLTLGSAYRYLGQPARATPALEEARELALLLDLRHSQAFVLWHLASWPGAAADWMPLAACSSRALTWCGSSKIDADKRNFCWTSARSAPTKAVSRRPTSCWPPPWPPGPRIPRTTAFVRRPWMHWAGFAPGSSAMIRPRTTSPRRFPGGRS